MQIACEKCSTVYTLDDRLLPPGGAPVQCTRCGHVFTAVPDSSMQKTALNMQIFGHEETAEPSAPPPSPDPIDAGFEPPRTQLFGKSALAQDSDSVPPAPAHGAQQPARSSTQTFGAAAPTPAPSRSASVGSAAAATQPAMPAASRATTQIFGSIPAASTLMRPGTAPTPAAAPQPAVAPEPAGEDPSWVSSTRQYGAVGGDETESDSLFGVPGGSLSGDDEEVVDDLHDPEQPAITTEPSSSAATQQFGVAQVEEALNRAAAWKDPNAFSDTVIRRAPQAPTIKEMPGAPPPSPALTGAPRPAQFSAKPPQEGAQGSKEAPYTPKDARDLPGLWDTGVGRTVPAPAPAPVPREPAPRDFSNRPTEPESPKFPTSPAAPAAVPRSSVALPPASATPQVALPPDDLLDSLPGRDVASADDPSFLLREQIRRRNRNAVAAVLVLALGIIGFFAYKLMSSHASRASAQTQAAIDSAMSQLRRDDAASREKCVEQLQKLQAEDPELVEAQAGIVIALALQLDDAKLAIRRLEQDADSLNKRIAKLNEAKSPSDWQNRVNAMTDQLQAVKKEMDPLTEQASALDGKLGEAFKALPAEAGERSAREQQALVRALAIYYGVKGSEQALALNERYQALGGTDGWGAIAFAEYALNAKVPPDTLVEAHSAVDSLITRDSAFLRAYVLSARLSIAQKKYDVASNALEATVSLNPTHEVAQKLRSWVNDAVRNAAAEPSPQ